MNKIHVKLFLQDSIRRFSIAKDTSFADFLTLIRTNFNVQPQSLLYEDNEGDMITLNSSPEWECMISNVDPTSGALKIKIPKSIGKKAPEPVPNTSSAPSKPSKEYKKGESAVDYILDQYPQLEEFLKKIMGEDARKSAKGLLDDIFSNFDVTFREELAPLLKEHKDEIESSLKWLSQLSQEKIAQFRMYYTIFYPVLKNMLSDPNTRAFITKTLMSSLQHKLKNLGNVNKSCNQSSSCNSFKSIFENLTGQSSQSNQNTPPNPFSSLLGMFGGSSNNSQPQSGFGNFFRMMQGMQGNQNAPNNDIFSNLMNQNTWFTTGQQSNNTQQQSNNTQQQSNNTQQQSNNTQQQSNNTQQQSNNTQQQSNKQDLNEKHKEGIKKLKDMGFYDETEYIPLLEKYNGNLDRVISDLLG